MGETPTMLDLYTEEGKAGLERIKELVEEGYHFVFHNAMFDIKWFRTLGIELPNWEDTRLMSKGMSLGMNLPHHLDDVITRAVGYNPYDKLLEGNSEAGLSDKRSLQMSDWSAPVLSEAQIKYALTDVGPEYHETFKSLWKDVQKPWFWRCYQLDKQVAPIAAEMIANGLKFDVPKWKEYIAERQKELEEVEEQLDAFIDEWTQKLYPERFMITLKRNKPAEGKPARYRKDGTLLREEVAAQTIGNLAAVHGGNRSLPRAENCHRSY
ncbi:MAG: hypothetical protein MZW92_31270 [Comamonadaceae bacterium]|nr:hypothetical protein [Comamonadaceae bacterium]